MSAPTFEIVPVDDAQLWTATSGQGETAIVLCHGGPGLSDNLGDLAGMLEDRAVVHRYDQRAGGRSTGDPPFTVDRFVEDLDALRAHWGHPSWIVIGHSWGGWLGLQYAMRYQARVAGIVTIGTPPPPKDWQEEYQERRTAGMTAEERLFFVDHRNRRKSGQPVSAEDEQRWSDLSSRADFVDPTVAERHLPLFEFPANQDVNRALNAEMDRWDATTDIGSHLALIHVPVLMIHGGGDPRPAPVSIAEALPQAELIVIPDTGHFPWLERPVEVATALRGSLSASPE